MPFGRHKGRDLRDVPERYLLWLRDSSGIDPEFQSAIRQELFDRSTRRLVSLLRKSPGAAALLETNIRDLIRTAKRAGYESRALNELYKSQPGEC